MNSTEIAEVIIRKYFVEEHYLSRILLFSFCWHITYIDSSLNTKENQLYHSIFYTVLLE
jgi:hypothetical protein